ncbi:MAG: glycoside hydrolase family 125 protein [Exilibacterium sp.]
MPTRRAFLTTTFNHGQCNGVCIPFDTSLKSTDACTGFMHETFNKNDPSIFTRSWFAWANTLFVELILGLHKRKQQ